MIRIAQFISIYLIFWLEMCVGISSKMSTNPMLLLWISAKDLLPSRVPPIPLVNGFLMWTTRREGGFTYVCVP